MAVTVNELWSTRDTREGIDRIYTDVRHLRRFGVNTDDPKDALDIAVTGTGVPVIGETFVVPTTAFGAGGQTILTCTDRWAFHYAVDWCIVECEYTLGTGIVTEGFKGIGIGMTTTQEVVDKWFRKTATSQRRAIESQILAPALELSVQFRQTAPLGLGGVWDTVGLVNETAWQGSGKARWLFLGMTASPVGINIYDCNYSFANKPGTWLDHNVEYDPRDGYTVWFDDAVLEWYEWADFNSVFDWFPDLTSIYG